MKEFRHLLGKYSGEFTDNLTQEKYLPLGLSRLMPQRFKKDQYQPKLIIDSKLQGLQFVFSGNTVRVSQAVIDHPGIQLHNKMTEPGSLQNPRSDYNAAVIPSVAYLLCQHFIRVEFTTFIDSVVYIKYETDFETMQASVVDFVIGDTVQVDIVEEILSYGVYAMATNYHVGATAKLRLHTFYNNGAGGNSLHARHVYLDDRAGYTHGVLAYGSNITLDESRLYPKFRSNSRLYGVISTEDKSFHTVVTVHPVSSEYAVTVDYRNVVTTRSNTSLYAGVAGDDISSRSYVNSIDLNIDNTDPTETATQVAQFVKEIMDEVSISNRNDTAGFYHKKNNFKLIN